MTDANSTVMADEARAFPGWVRALLVCGIVSSMLYLVADVVASSSWAGYVYANQAVSELAALGSPVRPLMVGFFTAYNALVIAFAIGVWQAAGSRRSIKVSAAMLAVYAGVGELTTLLSPMHVRGSVTTATDTGHILLTAVEVLSLVLFIAFGSVARGQVFLWYSIVSIAIIMAAGIATGTLSTHMTASPASTPWAGLLERVNIYLTMAWIVAFAGVLLTSRGGEDREASEVVTPAGVGELAAGAQGGEN